MSDIKGVGLGLRYRHFKEFITDKPYVPWLEIHSENFFSQDSTSAKYLAQIRQHYPISAHCIGLSLGSAANACPMRAQHLQNIKATIDWLQPSLVSDHLSWSASDQGHYLPDLLQRQILIENPSSYLSYVNSPIPEWEFLSGLVKKTGCALLLDVNNIHVSAHNHGFDALKYLANIPIAAVKEIHLAGYSIDKIEGKDVYIDTHGHRVYDGVWQLYEKAIERFGVVPTLIEWDTDVPELATLLEEKHKAEAIICKVKNMAKLTIPQTKNEPIAS